MSKPSAGEITGLLNAIREGSSSAKNDLIDLVYSELRAVASRQVSKNPKSGTLSPTALVHEAYMKLFPDKDAPSFENRAHFFWAAARAMRDLLVDKARARRRQKRGAGIVRVELDSGLVAADMQGEELLAINEAIGELEKIAERPARVVILRFYGGLNHAEVAATLRIAESTVRRDWKFAQTWLFKYLSDADEGDGANNLSIK